MITEADLDNWFVYHPPTGPEQVAQYQRVRDAGRVFEQAILMNSPASADQSAAIRKVREAVFTTHAAIACGGK